MKSFKDHIKMSNKAQLALHTYTRNRKLTDQVKKDIVGDPLATLLLILLVGNIKFYIEKSWPEAVTALASDPKVAYEFAVNIDDRFPEGEPMIMKSPKYARKYACFILQRRWLEAEQYIKQDQQEWLKYSRRFGIR